MTFVVLGALRVNDLMQQYFDRVLSSFYYLLVI